MTYVQILIPEILSDLKLIFISISVRSHLSFILSILNEIYLVRLQGKTHRIRAVYSNRVKCIIRSIDNVILENKSEEFKIMVTKYCVHENPYLDGKETLVKKKMESSVVTRSPVIVSVAKKGHLESHHLT